VDGAAGRTGPYDGPVPPVGGTHGTAAGAGTLLQLIRDSGYMTRTELASSTGFARSTVSQRVDALLAHSLVVAAGDSVSTGGRPPRSFAFNADAGLILAADLGATHSRIAITDLAAHVLAEDTREMAIAQGPEAVLSWLEEAFVDLVAQAGRAVVEVRGVGVGVPGPVEFAAGIPVAPPIMPGWDGYPVAQRLRERFDAPTLLDNDVNLMALGEHWSGHREFEHMLYVKVGTGIGSGIISDGRIHRGAQGAAGDIGHIRLPGHDDTLCRCGNAGCLEAIAGGGAMAAILDAEGIEAKDARGLVELVRAGNPRAMQLVRQAGRDLGEVLAAAVNFLNPGIIVVGGDIAHAHEHLLAGVREVVYQRALPLGTRSLRITHSTLDDRAGIVGAAVMAIEHVLAPEAVDSMIAEQAA
jgi:predicted NBD/HSP70 family sugar kinase